MAPDRPPGRIVIITGLSGSGKSTALNALEDSGYFCIDNLPVQLLPKFLAFHSDSNPEIVKLGVVMDLREKKFIHDFKDVFAQIQSQHYELHITFLEASDQVLVKRFSETRRRHPLASDGGLLDGIRQERLLMLPVREAAREVIDTSGFNVHQLRELCIQKFARIDTDRLMSIEILSFGFKHGLPPESDILMDVRFMPNPFYLDELRDLDGRDKPVVEYVLAGEESRVFIDKLHDLLEFLIPLYRREGKSYLALAVGCTGGQHRSVTVVEELARRLKEKTPHVSVRHRDLPSGRGHI